MRSAKPGDLNYVANSWLRGLQRSTYFAMRVQPALFWRCQPPLVQEALGECKVLVAHPKGDEDTILGWIAFRPPGLRAIIHWTYVRSSWRGIGIARALVDAAGLRPESTSFPTWSFDCNTLHRKFPAEFNPYLR